MTKRITMRDALRINAAILQTMAKVSPMKEDCSFLIEDQYITIKEALDMADAALEPTARG